MKRLINFHKIILVLALTISISLGLNSTTTYAKSNPPSITADSAVVIDAETGQIIYSKNPDKKHFPASTTKVMTALLTLENTNLHDVIKVGKNPPYAEGSSIGLKEGEEFTVEDILTGLMLESGNDCALALAEHISGTEENFAKLMNKKATEIGCKNTTFYNPSGLPNEKHLTTAYDLSLILREAMKYKDFVRISRVLTKELPPSNLDGAKRFVNNHNHLINPNSSLYYDKAVAGKSGYTEVARHTFTIAATKDNRTIVGSFLKADDKTKNFKDMKTVLNYAFDNSENTTLYKKNDVVEKVELTKYSSLPLVLEKDFVYTKIKDEVDASNTKLQFDLPNDIKEKTLKKGDKIADAKVLANGQEIGTVAIVSGESRNYDTLVAIKEFSINNPGFVAGVALVLVILLIIIIKILVSRKKKINRQKKWNTLTNSSSKRR